MSATDQMRAMLDELMGSAREGNPKDRNIKFDDPSVCKSFLLGCCPHDILSSTRMDLGECHKIHELALRADFERASKKRDYFYDIDAMEHLESFIADCDRKVEVQKRKLKETQEELSEEATAKAEIIHMLGEQIGITLAKAEEEGAKGDVQMSLKLMEEVEELKKKKTQAEIEYRNSMPASSYQQQKLRVCDVCSAYLGIHDNDRRLADHFGGKLHLGFIEIREKLNTLQQSVTDRRLQREKERDERRKQRERSRSRERKRSRSRSRERKRRSRSRSYSRRHRSSSRDRRKRRSRSRSRSSRSHGSRRRSRSRSRSRKSSRRSSSRSKKSKRSRSRSRSRSKVEKKSRSKSPSAETKSSNNTENGENTTGDV